MCPYRRPVHEICVDKTDCRRESPSDNPQEKNMLEPTGHWTKDHIRKVYEDNQQQKVK
ncbi:hypothetical protein SAMN05660235_00740 [Sporolituus thermophilus DSM 23256]|uniref:Uncharacterized protein n=1 Tax=Sporolituus thermophilus DSM 23256 TaxID=1123285 RepID=A0A1G7J3H5_9FIRM|nr:hypothetical protein SAMN05660235_00740 [Sporolituus thermophilus DSM 23256]